MDLSIYFLNILTFLEFFLIKTQNKDYLIFKFKYIQKVNEKNFTLEYIQKLNEKNK